MGWLFLQIFLWLSIFVVSFGICSVVVARKSVCAVVQWLQ